MADRTFHGILRARQTLHRRLAAWTTLKCIFLAVVLPAPSDTIELVLAAIIITALGIPHGALDAVLGLRASSRYGLLRVTSAYLALAAATLGAWMLFPPLALVGFLVISAYHFGRGDTSVEASSPSALEIGVRGAVPIVLPIAFHCEDVTQVFAALTMLPDSRVASVLSILGPACAALWALGALVWVGRCARSSTPHTHVWSLVELAVLTACCYVMPPLLAFAIYFSLWHSARHLITIDTVLTVQDGFDRARIVRNAIPILLATFVILGAAFAILAGAGLDPSTAGLQVVFIGLASLTVPHMAITRLLDAELETPRPISAA